MTPDPLHESLTKLDDKYQILTELHHCGESRTYLARNLELNRDVTVTVARVKGDRAFLNAYAADADVLKTKRHPNIMPVLEASWLDEATFAVVRARVRGSTLNQTIAASGAMPRERIAAALNELTTALIWARENGITSRWIEPETFVFQQSTERVLIGFEPSQLIAGDVETIEALAQIMNGGARVDVSEYTSRLGTLPVTTPRRAAVVSTSISSAEEMAVQSSQSDREVVVPVGSDGAVVERPNRGMGFLGRVLTTFGVIGAVAVGGFFFMQHRRNEARTLANAQTAQQESAGDVSPHTALDTAAAYSSAYPTISSSMPAQAPPNIDSIGRENEKRIAEAKAQAAAMSAPYGSPSSAYPSAPYPSTPYPSSTPPATSATTTNATTTASTTTTTVVPRTADVLARPATDSAGRPELIDPCGSPIDSDQAHCITTAIDRADRSVNGVYQRLIEALRRQAGVTAADPDPSSVEELRASQRSWLENRETSCKTVGTGAAFYAHERSACYADRSSMRKDELQRQLDATP